MYLDYFGFQEFPFSLTPDASYLYMSPSHSQALAYMEYAIMNRDGFLVITGEPGLGKTTLVKKLLDDLDKDIIVAKIFQTHLDEVELLQAILVEFGINPFQEKKVELLNMLNHFLIDSYTQGKHILLIIDDAQNLNKRTLEELTMLSGVETQKEKILHIILVGQPELNIIIEDPDMEQLSQRIGLRYHLRALTEAETKEYVIHRLKIAGSTGKRLFIDEIFQTIYEYSGGVPRLINTVCNTALTVAYAEEKKSVNKKGFNTAIDELQWDTYSESQKKAKHSLDKVNFYNERDVSGDSRDRSHNYDPVLYRAMIDISRQLTRIADLLEDKNKFISHLSTSVDSKKN